MRTLLSNMFQKRSVKIQKHRSTTRLELENLETRSLLSVTTPWFSGNTLVVPCDNAATHVSLDDSGAWTVIHETNGLMRTWSYPTAGSWFTPAIHTVEFQGGAGNDRFINYYSSMPTRAFGFGGDDYLEGYNAKDVFVGGDGDDTLVGYGGNDEFWGSAGNDTLKGMAGNDSLVGGTGNDLCVGGDGDDVMWGEDGHDTLVGGAGTDTMYGGYGDDTLVCIDAYTNDYADGGAGYDTAWVDMNWAWYGWFYLPSYDTAYAEQVHYVSSFANGADRTLNGDWIADPTDGTNYKNFASNPLFGRYGPTIDDVDQEALGDCWLLAPLGSIANDHQYAIRRMVADFGDGTYGVWLGSSFYRVDADLPTWSAASTDQLYAGLGHDNSLWVAIIEKAYAHYRTGANTYASLAWGNPGDALGAYHLTSVGTSYFTGNATAVANSIYTHWNAYQSTTLAVGSVPSGSPLVGSHAYSVDSVYTDGSGNVTWVRLRNPWGGDNTGGNPYVWVTPAQLAACQIWVQWGNS
jgi:hypothetical protein